MVGRRPGLEAVRRVGIAWHHGKLGAHLNGVAIAKRVPAVNPDGSTDFIPRRQAWEEAKDQRADWDDPLQQNRIYRRPQHLIPNAVLSQGKKHISFEDVWHVKDMTWQVRRGALAGVA